VAAYRRRHMSSCPVYVVRPDRLGEHNVSGCGVADVRPMEDIVSVAPAVALGVLSSLVSVRQCHDRNRGGDRRCVVVEPTAGPLAPVLIRIESGARSRSPWRCSSEPDRA